MHLFWISAKKSEVSAQLALALAWNRSDIAKNEIFGASRKTRLGVGTMTLL